ncbi:MAG TPA: efflux transporter outer membrane subunit [Casimicrobiaceae bacterium]|nr:efflux transporter outer membrane subunit [Casimicrobiaceae bacterium]
MKALRTTGLLITTLLCGCMVGPNYQRPDLPMPTQYPDVPPSSAASEVRPDWWSLWGDPELDHIVDLARTNNTDIGAAVARVEEANGLMREANAALFPSVNLNGTAGRGRSIISGVGPVTGNFYQITLGTSFEIDFWGRLRRLLESARAQALGTSYARDVTMLTVTGITVQTYFTLRSIDAQIAATRATLATRDQYLALVRRRAEGGVSSDLDLNQAIGARADAAAQLDELSRQRALAQHLLGVLAGQLDLALPSGDINQLPLPAMPPPGLPSALLERRPDVRQAEETLVSANAQIGAARAALFPTLSLTGDVGGQSTALTNLLSNGGRIWSIAFGLAQPIFNAGRLEAAVDVATAQQREAVAGYQRTLQTAFREVADALTNVNQFGAEETNLRVSLDAARNTLRLASRRYEAGYSAYLEVLDAQRSLNVAELAYVRNRQALLSAQVDLLRALGGGWQPTGDEAVAVVKP